MIFKYLRNCKLKTIDAIDKFTERQEKLNELIVQQFARLGGTVARNPFTFVTIPLILAGIAATGVIFAIPDDKLETTLPTKGKWADERNAVENNFNHDTALNFDPIRSTNVGTYVNVILLAKDGGSILRDEVWNAIVDVNDKIKRRNVTSNDTTFSYNDVCAGWQGMCLYPLMPIKPDYLTSIGKLVESLPHLLKLQNVSFDVISPFIQLSLGLMLGNPRFNENGILTSAEAISLYFWLRSDTTLDNARALQWEKHVSDYLEMANFPEVNALVYTGRSANDELTFANEAMKPYLAISGVLMVLFAAFSSASRDWVRSKIILSVLGIASVVLATGAAFGLLIYCNVPFIGMNYVSIFLMLGIGIDDMFVFLAAWRMTSLEDSVEYRLSETYRHSCLAITITSMTNGISFFIGSFTDLIPIHIFSIYTGLSCIFTYISFLTFFGGCLALFGSIERCQRHSIFCCLKAQPKSMSGSKSFRWGTFLSGGINPLDPTNPLDNTSPLGMELMRDYVGGCLNNIYGKGFICALYIVYVVILSFGLSELKFEDVPTRVFFRNITKDYYKTFDQYFSKSPSFAQIVLTKELDYSSESTWEKILNLHQELEALPFVRRNLTISWMRDWAQTTREMTPPSKQSIYGGLNFAQRLRRERFGLDRKKLLRCSLKSRQIRDLKWKNFPSLPEIEIRKVVSSLKNFLCGVDDSFLHLLQEKKDGKYGIQFMQLILWVLHQVDRGKSFYETDIKFTEDLNNVGSSRFIIVVENASSGHVQMALRKVVAESGLQGASVYNLQAIVSDQAEFVKRTTLFATVSTAIIVLIISLVFIPNLFCSLWIAFSIVSIELGIVGFMVFWGVPLDAVAMINLIMCVGFSVDFSAHIAYAYLNSSATCSKDRIPDCLYNVGYPILLGGLSTIVGVLPLWFTNFDTFITFFKIIFLVIALGMLHGLFFLPVFMSIVGPKNFDRSIKKSNNFYPYLEGVGKDSSKSITPKLIYATPDSGSNLEITPNDNIRAPFKHQRAIENDYGTIKNKSSLPYISTNKVLGSVTVSLDFTKKYDIFPNNLIYHENPQNVVLINVIPLVKEIFQQENFSSEGS